MALMRAPEAVMAHFRPILAEHDLTEQQWRVLRALIAADQPRSVGALADDTFLLGPSLSRMLVTLDDRGLIERRAATGDARRAEIDITPAGRALVALISPRSEAVYAHIESEVGASDLGRLPDLLARIADIR